MKHIRLQITRNAFRSKVWIDGQEVTNLRGVEVRAHVNELTEVVLSVIPEQVEVEAEVDDDKVRTETEPGPAAVPE